MTFEFCSSLVKHEAPAHPSALFVCLCVWFLDTLQSGTDVFLSSPPPLPLSRPRPHLLQSLSAPQAQTLSCVESLCCYQHGQSGCARVARLLEHVSGRCRASADQHHRRHTSGHSNRWGRAGAGAGGADRAAEPCAFENFGLSPDTLL